MEQNNSIMGIVLQLLKEKCHIREIARRLNTSHTNIRVKIALLEKGNAAEREGGQAGNN